MRRFYWGVCGTGLCPGIIGLSRAFPACRWVCLFPSTWCADCISSGLRLSRNQWCGRGLADAWVLDAVCPVWALLRIDC